MKKSRAEVMFDRHSDSAMLLLISKDKRHPYKDYININSGSGISSYKGQNMNEAFDKLLQNEAVPTFLVHHYKNEYNWVGKCIGKSLSSRDKSPDGIPVLSFRVMKDNKFSVNVNSSVCEDKTVKWRYIKHFLEQHNLEIISGHISHGIMLVKPKIASAQA